MKLRIWKRCGHQLSMLNKIATVVEVTENDIVDLDGFKCICLEHDKQGYVFEITSGGLVGDTIKSVKNDIESCGDIKFMRKQIKLATKESKDVLIVDNKVFWSTK